jgi:hypothetical protein
VESSDAELLALDSNVLGSKHGSVGRGLIAISLDLHASSDTDNGFATSQVSNVLKKKDSATEDTDCTIYSYHKSVVGGSKDVGNTEDELVGADLGTERNVLLNFSLADLLQTRTHR